MKGSILKITRLVAPAVIALALFFSLGTTVLADEGKVENGGLGGEYTEIMPDNQGENVEDDEISTENYGENGESGTESGDIEENIFDSIYSSLESNADKIFSILAFIGTLVVGVGYKSGLLPLLRDALSKLKSSIDRVKADSETMGALTERKMDGICTTLDGISVSVSQIEDRLEDYEYLMQERDSMRTILAGQIDMLYAIFMSSGLPQYQKDEIGEKIKEMREELRSYEATVEN
jgi:hypothetical protein